MSQQEVETYPEDATSLGVFFTPKSVAVIGASREPGKVGHDILKNLIDTGFEGPIYPVNPKADEVLGLQAHPDMASIPADSVDLAVIVIPSKYVLAAIDQCAEKGVKGVIIISAGFKEAGPEGVALEKQLTAKCKEHGIRCIGPNCLGVISTPHKLNASFAADTPHTGNIAFFSQSGALGTAILDISIGEEIGLSQFISFGNKADVDETDLLQALCGDDDTRVILGYLEGVKHGGRFMDMAKQVTKQKPVIVLKSGRTAAGARAASSHTGTLAGADRAFNCAFEQCGILRAQTAQDIFDWAIALANQSPPKGNRVVIVTNAGGPGIIATDAIENSQLTMTSLTPEVIEKLRQSLPPTANVYNPVDVLGDAKADRYKLALDLVVDDPNVDAILILITPQTSTEVAETARVIGEVASRTDKPIITSLMGIPAMAEGKEILKECHVPNYEFPERAVSALNVLYRYSQWLQKPEEPVKTFEADKERVQTVIDRIMLEGRTTLGEQDARELLEAYGIRVPRSILAKTLDEACKAAEQVGFPVVMKISSPDILHKSDVGGVRVGLKDRKEVALAFFEIINNAVQKVPDSDIRGVLVQEMVKGGKEVILGMSRDAQFGPMLMFGLGGIYVEVLKDVTFGIAPVTASVAREMIDDIRAVGLLRGVRGEAASDINAIVDAMQRLSQLVTDFPYLAEADVNPLKVFETGQGVLAVDARFTIDY